MVLDGLRRSELIMARIRVKGKLAPESLLQALGTAPS